MPVTDTSSALDLCRFIDSSPSPYHAVQEAALRLTAAGFTELDQDGAVPAPGRPLIRSGGALIAWADEGRSPDAPLRIVGAHTDSPNLRLKPVPDRSGAGCRQVGVEVYGGALLNSWLDRDLGFSGRLVVRNGAGTRVVLVRDDRPVARIPQLAVHLDRGVNDKGLVLNPQVHLSPVLGPGTAQDGDFAALVASAAGVDPGDVLAFDAPFIRFAFGHYAALEDPVIVSLQGDTLPAAERLWLVRAYAGPDSRSRELVAAWGYQRRSHFAARNVEVELFERESQPAD